MSTVSANPSKRKIIDLKDFTIEIEFSGDTIIFQYTPSAHPSLSDSASTPQDTPSPDVRCHQSKLKDITMRTSISHHQY